MVSVAFFTLLERRVLGYSHNRFGPNKVIILGGFQPFGDAVKLFLKEDFKHKELNLLIYVFSPALSLFLGFYLWAIFCFWGFICFINYSFLFFICARRLGVYFILYRGWRRFSTYRLLGRYRSSAQSISYEVPIILCFLILVFSWYNTNLARRFLTGGRMRILFLYVMGVFCWGLSCVAECNRSPFDLSEGESELVSGFNTEYSGGIFSFIFIREYRSIVFISFLSSILLTTFLWYWGGVFLSFIYLWVRCSFPRIRYDVLMLLAWKSLCFIILGVLLFLVGVY